jgi:hypothetical protein
MLTEEAFNVSQQSANSRETTVERVAKMLDGSLSKPSDGHPQEIEINLNEYRAVQANFPELPGNDQKFPHGAPLTDKFKYIDKIYGVNNTLLP